MRIKELTLYSGNFSKQISFYTNIMGLVCVGMSEDFAVFRLGDSTLRLVKSNLAQPCHFAINIPCNKENNALAWLKQRVEILTDGKNEMHEFTNWNAKAMYFYDADKNIVEFIARKNLKNESCEDFSSASLLAISEIGMPVSAIEPCFRILKDVANMEIFDGGLERFCAIGDENGLFICINKTVKDWFPTGDKACSSPFEIRFEKKGHEYTAEFKNEELIVNFNA